MPGKWGKCRRNTPSWHVVQNGASFHSKESGASMEEVQVGKNLMVFSGISLPSTAITVGEAAGLERLGVLCLPGLFLWGLVWNREAHSGQSCFSLLGPADVQLTSRQLKDFFCSSSKIWKGKNFAWAKKIKIAKQNLTTQRHRMPGQGGFKNGHQRAQSFLFPWSGGNPILGL